MIELHGEIWQEPHAVEERVYTCELRVDTQKYPLLRGTFGFSVWWFPFANGKGIKIFNVKQYNSFDEAYDASKYIWNMYLEFYNQLDKAKEHCPIIYETTVVRHTGHSVRGGSNRKTYLSGYFPAFIMKAYEWPLIVGKGIANMKAAFEADGFQLHKDTFAGVRNLGVHGTQYVVLDITDNHQKKYL